MASGTSGTVLTPVPDLTVLAPYSELGCAAGVPWQRLVRKIYNSRGNLLLGTEVLYVDSAGVETPFMPAGFTLGACSGSLTSAVSHTEEGCAAGVPWTRRTTLVRDAANVILNTLISYINSAGAVQASAPAGFTLGSCSLAGFTAAARFQTTVVDVISGTPEIILPGTDLVHWAVVSRIGATNTLIMNTVAVNVPLGETLSSQSVTSDGGTLTDAGVAIAGTPTTSRMTLIMTRRLP